MGVGNRWSTNIERDHALREIATNGTREVKEIVTPYDAQLNELLTGVARTNNTLDALRKQMQPRLWEVQVAFGNSSEAVSPKLAVDLPVAMTWYQCFSSNNNPAGSIYFCDQDGARVKMQLAIVATASGPTLFAASGVMFRKNLSIKVDSTAPFPLYIVLQGINL